MNDIPKVDIRALASLSRITLGEEEAAHMEAEVRGILGFVQKVTESEIDEGEAEQPLRNVLREDAGAHDSGAYSEVLLKAAPMREGDHVEVKQVLSHVKKGGNTA